MTNANEGQTTKTHVMLDSVTFTVSTSATGNQFYFNLCSRLLKPQGSVDEQTQCCVFHVPGRGQEVEDTVEDIVQVCVALIHQQHHGIAAG